MKCFAFFLSLLVMVLPTHAQFGLPSIPGIPTGPGDVDVVKVVKGTGDMIQGASGIGDKEEQAIGGAVAVEIVARNGGIWKDVEATKRVATIGRALARYSARPEASFTFGILKDTGINGYSAPGGYVFITKGLYEAVKDDQELAGILAHEITHVTERHAVKVLSRNKFNKGALQVASGAVGSGSPDAFDDLVDRGVQSMFNVGYDPDKEFYADKIGHNLASDAGFDRDGLAHFLKRLYETKKDESYAFSHHPPLKHRIERLEN
ncbi:MAG: M48 family metalloprotease [Verrucomicrobiota bacterium]